MKKKRIKKLLPNREKWLLNNKDILFGIFLGDLSVPLSMFLCTRRTWFITC
ncbi:MAG: hypothetical protein OEV44_06160 [Spirochaetota bacterium]|nr:hypothetical protein [Spirochaetota bacterium]